MKKDIKNILLVYPEYLKTFWSFENAMKIIGKKAVYPPLGLLTISSMLPKHWNKKLVDTNTDRLNNSDIAWADYVFISGMIVQKESAIKIIERAKQANKPVVAGGPLFSTSNIGPPLVDHLLLGEAEHMIYDVVKDIEQNTLKKVYQSADFPDITSSPVPDWKLVNIFNYYAMSLQYSRGCPFGQEQKQKNRLSLSLMHSIILDGVGNCFL
jgi:radical SAM superfamily enzyme YgiQ (UPF0313 family)